MLYCGNTTNFSEIWVDKGINPCFLETITSGVLFIIILMGGCIQCSYYRKYSNKVPSRNRSHTLGSALQIFSTVLLILEAGSRIMVIDLMKINGGARGVDVLTFLCLFLGWCGTLRLMSLERNWRYSMVATRGHGLVLLAFWTIAFLKENLAFVSWWSHSWWWYLDSDSDTAEFALWIVRYFCSAILFLLGLRAPGIRSSTYNTLKDEEEEGPSDSKKEKAQEESTWNNVLKKLKLMAPYVWPKGSWWRQLFVLICLLILGAGRGINVLVPLYSKYIVNSLTYDQKAPGEGEAAVTVKSPSFRWDYILVYSILVFLKGASTGGSGFLNNVRTFLWIPVQQYTTRRIQVKLFSHLHNLSLSWHLQRKTGEILRVVDRGTNSINNLLNYVLFQIFPTIADIIIAVIYFVTEFNYLFGVVVFVDMCLYLAVTGYVTEWRTKYRREMNLLDNG